MSDSTHELTREEFLHRAAYLLKAEPEILDELYPMVRDLLVMADEVNQFAQAMGHKLDVNSLSESVSGNEGDDS